MLAQTDGASRHTVRHVIDVADFQFEPERWPQDPAPDESAFLLRNLTDAYERAIQCLRDVRHQLPAEGVAIVDAVLDYAR